MKLKLFFITILLTLILCSGIAVNAQTNTAVSIDSAVLNGTELSLTLHSDTETTAYIYAAEYNNGILSSLKLQSAALTASSSVISFDNIGSDTEIFILDKNLSPLCKSFYVSNITGDGIIHLTGDSINAAGIENVTVDGTTLTITEAGEYTIEGTLNNGQIIIASASKSDEITLNLDNVNISSDNENSAALLASKGKVSINAIGESTIKATGQGSAAIQTKHDLTIKSSGTLTAVSSFGKGIHCKADLEIGKGNISVTSYDDGIRGNDSVKITKKAGVINVNTSNGDGIRSNLDPSTEDDGTYISGGTVTINGGTLNVTAQSDDSDGIQADTLLTVSGGDITVNAGGEALKANASSIAYLEDSENAQTPAEGDGCIVINGGTLELSAGGHGIKAVKDITVSGGTTTITAGGEGIKSKEIIYDSDGETAKYYIEGTITISGGSLDITSGEDGIQCAAGNILISDGSITADAQNDAIQGEYVVYISGGTFNIKTYGGSPSGTASDSVTVSCKGIKAGELIDITGGTFTLDTYDDSIHTNNTIYISGGDIDISTGDDGVHADSYLYISDSADINITHCYEGLEAAMVYIDGGTSLINATDDGINGAGEQPDTAPYENPYTASDHSGLFTDTAAAAKTEPTMPGGHGGGQGGPNPGASEDASYGYIKVDGGYIYINNTNGDGLDSNGNMIINDGVIIVDGATLGSEDGLDYDGNIELNGGFVFTMTAGGIDSITESFSQKYLTYGYSGRGGFGSSSSSSSISNGSYAICDSNGNILCAFSRTKGSIQRILLSSPQISSSETYYIRPLNVTGVSTVNSIFGVIDSYSKEFTVYDSCSLNTSGSKYTMTIK